MKCDRCPIEDDCPELKEYFYIKEHKCPLEAAAAFLLAGYKAYLETGDRDVGGIEMAQLSTIYCKVSPFKERKRGEVV